MSQSQIVGEPSHTAIRQFRRVVTGHDSAGRSAILSDQDSPHVVPFLGIEGFVVTDLWSSTAAPVDNGPGTADDPCRTPMSIAPPAQGSIFRMTQFPPESTWRPARDLGETPASVEADHPHMHATATLDYAIVIEGEIWAVTETDEALLRAGDIVIQRGTKHAWANRSATPCVIAFVMIDAMPMQLSTA